MDSPTHTEEVKNCIQNQQVDIMLISETHFTTRSYFKIPNYAICDTQHPDVTTHGGTATLIKNGIKHHLYGHYNLEHLQATSITVEDWVGPLTIAAIHCPLKHTIKADQFRQFYTSLGHRLLAGGDCNAKHTHWGSRLIAPTGHELLKAMKKENLIYVSTVNRHTGPVTKGKFQTSSTSVSRKEYSIQHTSGGWL